MRFFHCLDAVCLFVVAAFILLETDAAPKTSTSNTKLKNKPAKQKNPGLTLKNHWNSNACHPHLTLPVPVQQSDSTPSKPEQLLVVEYKDNGETKRSNVFAVHPIPKTGAGIFYYEVTILKQSKLFISIGLCTDQMPLDKQIGDFKGTYAYHNFGAFTAGPDALLDRNGKVIPSFRGSGNVVGCGVDFKNNELFYTLNGERLVPTGQFVNRAVELFPCVTLSEFGDKIKANFGPKFQYSDANGI
uniref:B30.2/SPRY domain-containing protein n=1 Tax=Globodera rostochiensis TaxID=31243 RepID=A0A914I8Q7_GLORO